MATADLWDVDVSILLGDGIGGFVLFQSVSVGQDPGFVAIGDFNGFNRMLIGGFSFNAFANESNSSPRISSIMILKSGCMFILSKWF